MNKTVTINGITYQYDPTLPLGQLIETNAATLSNTYVSPSTPTDDGQKALQTLIDRRHPEYVESVGQWAFLQETYEGGREWFEKHIHKYLKEGEEEFKDRKVRAYRFNHTKEVVDLLQKYVFKTLPSRKEDAPDEVKEFWQKATLNDLTIDQFMQLISKKSSIYGGIWIFLDTTKTGDVQTKADQKSLKSRVYAYTKDPGDVLDFSFDDEGELNWILVREWVRDDANPFASTGNLVEQFRLWTRQEYLVLRIQNAGDTQKQKVMMTDLGFNSFGYVPAIYATHTITDERYSAPGLIDDIAYQDKAIANYLSNLDAIIQDQTFSQLAMPAQSTLPGETSTEQLLAMGTKRVFLYDSEGGEPKYLSPDPKQAGVILDVVNKIIGEIYHTVGLAGERTKQDNSVGIDNSSGVAKAYDFERVNALLLSKAQSLQIVENKVVEIVLDMNGKPEIEGDLVQYPSTFDVRSLYDEFTIAEKLVLIAAPDTVRREQIKQVMSKLFPYLSEENRAKMEAELKTWPPELPAAQLGPVAPNKPQATKPMPDKRQGQVTSATE